MEAAGVVERLMRPVILGHKFIQEKVNCFFQGHDAWRVVIVTCGATLAIIKISDLLNHEQSLMTRVERKIFKLLRKIPSVQKKISSSLAETSKVIDDSIKKSINNDAYMTMLPEKGMTDEEVLSELKRYREYGHVDWKEGWCSGMIYGHDQKLTSLLAKSYEIFAFSNPLHPEVFPDIRKMEAEIVRMTCSLFYGGPDSCGVVTTGGTESIMLACLAYRNRAMEKGIKIPEIIAPITAHAAFDKAAMVFRMKLTHIPVDPITRAADINAMRKAINKNTCVLIGSAPQFPHGIIDPLKEISDLGIKYNIPVHCDCCLGGFLIPFLDKAGYPIDPVDFRLPGVTSISADTHKYGQAPKGSAVLMYKNPDYRKHQWFSITNWPGGIYATPTFAGSRAGSEIAACWATMMYVGKDGYVESARKIIATTRAFTKILKSIDGLKVFGDPKVSVVAFGSDEFDIYRLSDALTERGWILNPLQFPPSIHICVVLAHTQPGVVERFEKDVSECVKEIMKDPSVPCSGAGALYGMSQQIPDRSVVDEVTEIYLDASYNTRSR